MIKRSITFILSICLLIQLNSYSVIFAAGNEENIQEPASSDNALDVSSYVASSGHTVNDIMAQHKFTIPKTGHCFAAERGNNLADKIKGKNARVVGDNNIQNGADRIINRDGTTIWIQDKYYSTASKSIDACFDVNTGEFRYFDGDGNPMQIEVPKDQWEDAVRRMRKKIEEGKIPGITDPDEADNLVRKGTLTYKQSENLAKFGTVESLKYDAQNGIVSASFAAGISVIINYSVCVINGEDSSEALKTATEEGLKTGGLAFGTSIIAGQLCKTGLMDVFRPSSEALVKAFGEDFAKALIKSSGESVLEVSEEATTETLIRNAARVLRAQALVAVVSTVVFSVPDAIDMFRGRISEKQFIKNFAITGISVAAGAAGYVAGGTLGSLIVPGIGTIPGAVVGSLLFGIGGGWAADFIADYIVEDDATEMYRIFQDCFVQSCDDFLVNETEAKNIVEQLNSKLTDDTFKDMYKSEDRVKFTEKLLTPLFENEIKKRPIIKEPSELDMRSVLKDDLKDVVFIH